MKSTPTVENATTWFNAQTVTHHLDLDVDVDTRTDEGSTVRFKPLFGEKLVGVRHAEDGRLYAILKDDDRTREEPVDLFPFAGLVTATRPYAEDEADYLL